MSLRHGAVGMWRCAGARLFTTSSPISADSRSLSFSKHGAPLDVLRMDTSSIPSPSKGEVLLKMVAAPVSILDGDDVRGSHPSSSAPSIGGNEGLAIVEQAADGVNLKVGQWVIPNSKHFGGTWRSHAVVSADLVDPVPSNIEPEYAATLGLSPCTAYRLLKDFENLNEGDVIIQNGANSQVGQTVVQLANLRGIKTINIVRSRADQADTIERIKAYGGYIVVDDQYLRSEKFNKLISDLPRPKLALNGVGGITATEMARTLAPGGTFVTYGNSSRQHLQFPSSLFLHNNINMKGFNLSKWVEEHSTEERLAMLKELGDLVSEKKLRFWLETHRFSDWKSAFDTAFNEQTNRKVVMMMEK